MQTAMPVKDQAVSANVEFYREIGKKYDASQACTSDTFFQEMLENDVDAIEVAEEYRAPATWAPRVGGSSPWPGNRPEEREELLRRISLKSCGVFYEAISFALDSVQAAVGIC